MCIEKRSRPKFTDISGQRFGRWTVLRRTEKRKKIAWDCKCDCGNERVVAGADLKSGKSKSCGCIQSERKGQTLRHIYSHEYNTWSGMKQRCFYEKHAEYHRYGGRGITVCKEWQDSFEQFLKDMGPRPDGASIDRIDNNGNYEPGNCTWAQKQQQSSNTSKNVLVEYDGEAMTLKMLAEKIGVNYFRLHAYYRRRGLSLTDSIEACQKPGINRPYRFRPSA